MTTLLEPPVRTGADVASEIEQARIAVGSHLSPAVMRALHEAAEAYYGPTLADHRLEGVPLHIESVIVAATAGLRPEEAQFVKALCVGWYMQDFK
jgi:hypothetical protein